MKAETRTLANGLRVTAIHDASATRAAALFQLSAGSHDAPRDFPGLAHLLEHVLFAGSEQFQDAERLMAWAPAVGAKLNATTLAHHTAWFFECDSPLLTAGFRRLLDMLAHPLFSEAAIAQEVAVIDAEYQMLSTHAETLCEAALSLAIAPPHRLHDFHVGHRAALGSDAAALQQALQAFHRRFFGSDTLELWLQGPQSLDALFALAASADTTLASLSTPPVATTALPLRLKKAPDFAIRHASMTRGYFSFPLTVPDRGLLTVFEMMLTDSTTGGLLDRLREAGLCDSVRLREPFRSDAHSLVSVIFDGAEDQADAIAALFFSWLRQLTALDAEQYAHYAALAARRCRERPVLDQLRDGAFGFSAPTTQVFNQPRWLAWLGGMTPENLAQLWVSPEINGDAFSVQGFTVYGVPLAKKGVLPSSVTAPSLFVPGSKLTLPTLPASSAPLTFVPSAGDALLLIAPQPGQPFSRLHAAQFEAALQPVLGAIAHQGGSAHFSREQGSWLLRIGGTHAGLCCALDGIITALNARPSDRADRLLRQTTQAVQQDVAIRVLLDALPDIFQPASSQPFSQLHWQATLYGGLPETHQAIARLLSRWPGNWNAAPLPATPTSLRFACTTVSTDAAVLLFIPVPAINAARLAAWQALAKCIEPRFFQRYRVERNLGYVVSARFHQAGHQAGMLFALQSPSYTVRQLEDAIAEFIADIGDIASAAEACFSPVTVQDPLPDMPAGNAQRLAHWQRQQLAIAPSAAVLTCGDLRAAAQQLCQPSTPRYTLHNQPD